jgi:hypothetical protein
LTKPFGGSIHFLRVPQQWWGNKPWEKKLFKNMMNLPQMMMKVVWVIGTHPLHGETISNNVPIL